MPDLAFKKVLTANDTGETGSHQAGILVPKGEKELLAFLPYLDPAVKNPDVWLTCIDEEGDKWKFRYVYYNNKRHDINGTRDEYRITHMTKYFRSTGALKEDIFVISGKGEFQQYTIKIIAKQTTSERNTVSGTIKLKGWSRSH